MESKKKSGAFEGCVSAAVLSFLMDGVLCPYSELATQWQSCFRLVLD